MSATHDETPPSEDHATMTTTAPDRAGEWIVPDISYVEPNRRFCAWCGRPIARRYWRESTPDGDLAFCGPEHAAMRASGPAASTRIGGAAHPEG